MENIVIKQNSKKKWILLGAGLIMTVASVLLVFANVATMLDGAEGEILGYSIKFIGGIGLLFFGGSFPFIAYDTFKNKNLLIVDSDGFTDNSTLLSVGFVPWSNVKGISIKTKLIHVEIKDRDKILSKLHWFKRFIFTLFSSSPLIAINLSTTKESAENICVLMNKHIES